MPINRERVQKFLYEVDSEITPSICADAGRLNGYKKLLDIYRAACTAWHNRSVEDIQGITAAVNEMCIARLILKDNQVGNAFYEPHLKGTNKTIDFLVNLVGREARIFYDVKTVQPTKQDAWDRYTNFQKEGWLTRLIQNWSWNKRQWKEKLLMNSLRPGRSFLITRWSLKRRYGRFRKTLRITFGLSFVGTAFSGDPTTWKTSQTSIFQGIAGQMILWVRCKPTIWLRTKSSLTASFTSSATFRKRLQVKENAFPRFPWGGSHCS